MIDFFRELSDSMKLFDEKNKELRRLVFYSERDIYYQYFEGMIDFIVENSNVDICYITSDANDPIFKKQSDRIKPFYVKHCLGLVISKLDAKAIVMTMPDLNNFFIQKGDSTAKFVYKFHAIVSTHQQYRTGAFDHYDSIFCVGQYQIDEIRKRESQKGLPAKQLIESGYHRIEKIYLDHQKFLEEKKQESSKLTVLVAPTWGDTSLFEKHLVEVIEAFKDAPYEVHLRPHPQSFGNSKYLKMDLERLAAPHKHLHVEMDMTRRVTIHQADILVTDRSGIAFEYAFGTERPVLFVDTPLKVSNPECDQLDIQPMENRLRNEIGVSINVSEINRIPEICQNFSEYRETYRSRIVELRERTIFNWLQSSKVEAEYILGLL